MDENFTITLSRMARRLGVSTAWLRAEAESGRIPAVKADDTYLFHAATVEGVLAERAAKGVENGR